MIFRRKLNILICIVLLLAVFNIWQYSLIKNKATINILTPAFNMFTQVGVIDPVRHFITGDGQQQGFLCYGPYQPLPLGKYWVEYKLRMLNLDQKDDPGKQLGYVDINVVDQQNYNSSSVFILKNFHRNNLYTSRVKFNVPPGSPKLEFRVYQNAGNALQLESIKVYPADLLSDKKKVKAVLLNLVLLIMLFLLLIIPWRRLWSAPKSRILLLILTGVIVAEFLIYKATLTTNVLSGRFALSSQISNFDKKNTINNYNKAGFLVYGPYWALKPGNYRVRFKILKHATGATGSNFGYVDVSSQEDPTVGASTELKDNYFQVGQPKEIALRFKVKKGMPKVEFRAFSFGNVNFSVTGIKLESLSLSDAFLLANFSLLLCVIPLFIYFRGGKYGRGLTQSQKLKVITLILLAGMVISLGYHLFQGKVMGYTTPFNTFLYDPMLRFSDYNQTYAYALGVTQGKNPYLASLPSVYFPFTFIMLYPLTLLVLKSSLFWYSVLTVFTFLFFIYNRTKSFVYPFLFALLSYPLMFLLDRGNIEGLLFLLLALFVYFYSARKYLSAVTVLAMAISLKLYPAVLLVLLISEKRFREAALCLLMVFLFSLSGRLFLQLQVPGSTIQGIAGNFLTSLGQFKEMYYGDRAGSYDIAFNHTLYNSFKSLNILNPFFNHNLFIRIYNSAALIVFGFISWYVIKVEKVQWRKFTLLISAMIFLPNISFDYTLINLYLPLMLYLGCDADPSVNDLPFILLFGLLLIPKNYFIISGKFSLCTFLSPLLVLTLWVLILVQGAKERNMNIQEKP